MRILSLNVSKAKAITYKNGKVLTGIFKVPVVGPRMVRQLNIDGDQQADLKLHGGIHKAVYAFPSEHYSYYQRELKQNPYERGQFGENLTTEGMLESDVRIGDRFRAGSVLFEVSQPRSPCYKFGIKMGVAEALVVCINCSKTGFYFRVIEEGMIQSGDVIELEFSNDTAPTVEEVHKLYYLDKKNIAGLKHAAKCEALTQVFRDKFTNRIHKYSKDVQ